MDGLLSEENRVALTQMREGAVLDLHAWGGDELRAYQATWAWLGRAFTAEQVRAALALYLLNDAVVARERGADV